MNSFVFAKCENMKQQILLVFFYTGCSKHGDEYIENVPQQCSIYSGFLEKRVQQLYY